jgi:hypothetical protein
VDRNNNNKKHLEVLSLSFIMEMMNHNTQEGNKRRKKKESKFKQKITPKSAECTIGSPKSRNHKLMT